MNLHFVLDDYTNEGPRLVAWRSGHEITNFHRVLSTTVKRLSERRLRASPASRTGTELRAVSRFPENQDMPVPIFTIYDLEKPT